jgi:predicted dienelactone hydrolase
MARDPGPVGVLLEAPCPNRATISGLAPVVVMAAPTNGSRLPFPQGFFRSLLAMAMSLLALIYMVLAPGPAGRLTRH